MRDVAAVVAAREFIDRAGTLWHVVEVDARHTPGARGDRCLLFSSPGAIRRVWHYPAEWSRVPAEELDALSWRQ
ncbi:MAG TPA: hypothetical protein VNW46_11900 [Gemmatimonadaceae bacterium]|jgi:hypothetical protein|nr:hypothetical protein [Gemmatimonadaceae bacterium]